MAKAKITNPTRLNPYPNYKFRILMNGRPVGGFRHAAVRKVQGVHKVGDVTLKRGVIPSPNLFRWARAAADGGRARHSKVAIVAVGKGGRELARWDFIRARIIKVVAGPFNAKGTEVAIETLELTNESIART